jgi:hypothetical protein
VSRRYYSSSAAVTGLATGVTAGATSLTVNAITGFPVQYPYTLILDPATDSEEVVEVTAGSGTNLTVVRGVDGTTALAHSSGTENVKHGVSARDFDESNAHTNSNEGHGTGSDIVGVSDAQELSSKTINLANNTVTGTLADFNTALQGANFASLAGTETLTDKTLASPTVTGNLTMTTDGAALQVTGSAAGIEVGALGTANTPVLDFHSGAVYADYDSRIIASGGDGSSGGGTLELTAATVTVNGDSVTGAWTAYSPTLGSNGGNATIGNGALSGRYKKIGKTVHILIVLVGGSTSTFGTGGAYIGSPFPVTPHSSLVTGTILPVSVWNGGQQMSGGYWTGTRLDLYTGGAGFTGSASGFNVSISYTYEAA